MDYTTLSLTEVRTALEDITRDVQASFGSLDARQLNWKEAPSRWSVAQCLEHLLKSNAMMFRATDEALAAGGPRGFWQRVPGAPRFFGRFLVRSMAPGTRKVKTTPAAEPSASDIAADIVVRFVAQQGEAVSRVAAVDPHAATRAIVTSPFAGFVTYSVLDAWRLTAAHERRHVEQARRVTQSQGFPT
jgi:hypothetical protein